MMFCGLRLPSLTKLLKSKSQRSNPDKPRPESKTQTSQKSTLGVFDLHLKCGCSCLWNVNERGKYPVAVDNMTSRVNLARTVGRAATRKTGHTGEGCSLHPEDPVQAEDLEAIYAVKPNWWMCPREIEGAECQDLKIDPPCMCPMSTAAVVRTFVCD